MYQLLPNIAEQRRRDLLAAIARERLAATFAPPEPQRRVHAAALAWLGTRFIAWGWRLRARYGMV